MITKVLIAIVAIIAVFAVFVSMQPSEFHVSRTTTISTPAEVIFPHINDLRKEQEWSPWAKLDPEAKNTFKGSEEGVGSVVIWSGNSKVGEGSMTIIESRKNEFVKFKLDFLKPMQATHNAEFSLKEEVGQTTVTWSMYGQNNFIGKAMGIIFNCDKMIGEQFEKGLANLKAVAESEVTEAPQE